jgi:hypothetical protein
MSVARPTISTAHDEKDDTCLKDGKMAADFPIDDTPTPTKILRMADELFPSFGADLKENPFDAHFRKAAEAVKSGELRTWRYPQMYFQTRWNVKLNFIIFLGKGLNAPSSAYTYNRFCEDD